MRPPACPDVDRYKGKPGHPQKPRHVTTAIAATKDYETVLLLIIDDALKTGALGYYEVCKAMLACKSMADRLQPIRKSVAIQKNKFPCAAFSRDCLDDCRFMRLPRGLCDDCNDSMPHPIVKDRHLENEKIPKKYWQEIGGNPRTVEHLWRFYRKCAKVGSCLIASRKIALLKWMKKMGNDGSEIGLRERMFGSAQKQERKRDKKRRDNYERIRQATAGAYKRKLKESKESDVM